MEPYRKINTQNVGELMRELLARKTIRERFSVSMPPMELAEAIWESYQAEIVLRHQNPVLDEDTKRHILEAASWLADPKGKVGLMLQGLYGNGKTTLMTAICSLVNFLYASPKRDEKYEFMLVEARQLMVAGSREDCKSAWREYLQAPLLAIDDLGEEPAEIIRYGMVHTPVKDLLLSRYREQRLTVVSTNLINTPENPQLDQRYGKRLVDRFREMMKIIVFRNPSYRNGGERI